MFRRVTEGLNKSGGGIDHASKEGRTKLRGSILKTIAERKLKKHPDYNLLVQFFPNKLAKYRKMFEKLTGTREGQQKLTDFYNKSFAKKSQRLPNIPTEKKLSVVPKKNVDVQSYTAFKKGKKAATGLGAVGPINEKSVFISARDRLDKSGGTKLSPLKVIPISEMHKHLMQDLKYRYEFKDGGTHEAITAAYNELIGRPGGKRWTKTRVDPETGETLSRTLVTKHNYTGGLYLPAPTRVTKKPAPTRVTKKPAPTRVTKKPASTRVTKKLEQSMFISAKDSLLKGSNEPPLVTKVKERTTMPEEQVALEKMYKDLKRWGVIVPKVISNSKLMELYTKHYPTTRSRSQTVVTPIVEASRPSVSAETRRPRSSLSPTPVGEKKAVVEVEPVISTPPVVGRTEVTSPPPTKKSPVPTGEEKKKSMFISAKDSLSKAMGDFKAKTAQQIFDSIQEITAKKKRGPAKATRVKMHRPSKKVQTLSEFNAPESALRGIQKRGIEVAKSVLSTKKRAKLPRADFAIRTKADDSEEKKESGNYPIPDLSHARNALAMVAQHGTPSEQAKVRAAVYKKYPELDKRKDVEKASPRPLPLSVGPIGKDDEVEEVNKSLDPALAARQNMKPMSTLGAMGGPVLGQVGFHNTTIGANFSKSDNITFDKKTLRVLKRPNR